MDEEVINQTIGIIEMLTNACKNCSRDESSYPISILIGNPGERGRIIPIPNHAAPAVVTSVIKEIMTDFMKFPGIEEKFTNEQIDELNRLIGIVSGDIEISIFPTKN